MSRRALLKVSTLALLACSHEPVQRAPKHASLLAEAVVAPAYESPASWRYHPRQIAPVEASRTLPDGGALLVGKRGERTLARAGTLAVSSSLAPEDLIAVLETDSGKGYWFVGASGTAYEASDPLGSFVRSSAPLEPLVRVTAAGHSILGISRQRALLRSGDGAATFTPTGPSGVEFVDVELARDGSGLALSVPERLWLTRDEGQTFTPIDAPARGAFALSRAEGNVYVSTLLGPQLLTGSPARLDGVVSIPGQADQQPLSPPRGPDASALRNGTAAWIGERYVEVASAPDAAGKRSFRLVSGPWTGPLQESHELATTLARCSDVRVAGFGSLIELACFRDRRGDAQPIDLYRLGSDGKPEPEPFVPYGRLDRFQMAAGAGGALVFSGVCARASSGCDPSGIYLRKEVSPERASEKLASTSNRAAESAGAQRVAPFELVPAAAPSLDGTALRLAFSVDGRSLYAIARRNKTARLGIFVSHDAGQTFEVRDLDVVRADAEEEEDSWGRLSEVKIESFAAAEDGSVSLVINEQRRRSLVVVDEQGHVLSSGKAPDASAIVAAAGLRAIAIAVRSREAWESLDGGVSWNSLGRFPIELCKNVEADCAAIQCASAGCVVGQELSRIGWGGQQRSSGDPLPPARTPMPEYAERRVLAPLACTLDDSGWQALPGVRELPNANDAARGKISWLAVALDEQRKGVTSVHGFGGARPHVELVSLLKPLDHSEGYAYTASNQIEGPAALRYPTVEDGERDTHLRDIEIAWDNSFEGKSYHARLADGGSFALGDYERSGRADVAAPALLSIAQGGLSLRLHHAAGNQQDTWFFDGKSQARLPPVPWPGALAETAPSADVIHDEGSLLAILLYQEHPGLVRARLDHGTFHFDAEAFSLPKAELFQAQQHTNIAYRGQAAGVYVQVSEPGRRAHAVFLPLRGTGPVFDNPVPVPTQADLPDRPNPCTSDERAISPRIVASYQPGTRHPVVVLDPLDPPRTFLTARGVLHGTPEHPCVATFDAEPVVSDTGSSRSERLLIDPGDLEHGWLFRTTLSLGNEFPRAEYRLMKCRYDQTLEVPKEVYAAPGTLVAR